MRRDKLTWAVFFDQAGVLLLGVVPPIVLVQEMNARAHWLLWGSLAWGIALPLKFALSVPVSLLVRRRAESIAARVRLAAMLLGLVSACTELGVAAYLFHSNRHSGSELADILAFAFGAGCTEALVVLAAAIWGKPEGAEQVEHWTECAKVSWGVRHVFFIERFGALAGQVASRGLVCLAVGDGMLWPAAFALLSFSATDSLAAYGSLRKWDFFAPRVCSRFYGALTLISALEVAALSFFSSIAR